MPPAVPSGRQRAVAVRPVPVPKKTLGARGWQGRPRLNSASCAKNIARRRQKKWASVVLTTPPCPPEPRSEVTLRGSSIKEKLPLIESLNHITPKPSELRKFWFSRGFVEKPIFRKIQRTAQVSVSATKITDLLPAALHGAAGSLRPISGGRVSLPARCGGLFLFDRAGVSR